MSDFVIENGVLKKYTGNGGDVVIPDGVTEIENGAFYSCTNLTSITIPGSVTRIRYCAFYECTSLTSVTIPEGVKIIDGDAFWGCCNLRFITLPASLVDFGSTYRTYLEDCIQEVIIPNGLPAFGNVFSRRGVGWMYLYSEKTGNAAVDREGKAWVQTNAEYLSLEVVRRRSLVGVRKFLSSYRKVKPELLDGMIALATERNYGEIAVVLMEYKATHYPPEVIEQLEENAMQKMLDVSKRTYADWRKIFKISIEGDKATVVAYKDSSPIVYIPAKIGKYSVTTIAERAFKNNKTITSVIIEDGVEDIQRDAFLDCANLRTVDIPKSKSEAKRS